jgi:hypothetical protein
VLVPARMVLPLGMVWYDVERVHRHHLDMNRWKYGLDATLGVWLRVQVLGPFVLGDRTNLLRRQFALETAAG